MKLIFTPVVFLAGILLAAACDKNPLGVHPAICSQGHSEFYSSVDQVPAGEWLRLLMSQENRRMDCTEQTFEPAGLPLRCAKAAPPGTARDLPIRSDQLSVGTLPDGYGILSLPVEEFTNGDQTLLVALVHSSKKSLTVLGIGALRLPAEQTKLELHAVRGEELLFAQGAECAPGEDAGKCDRKLKLLLLHEGRFVQLELRDEENRCHGEAAVDLARSQEVGLKSGWRRRFELVSTYEVTDEGLVVSEQLIAMDRPRDGNDDNARLFRKSDSTRLLEFTGAYFVYSRESLWSGMREVRGDLQTNKTQSFVE